MSTTEETPTASDIAIANQKAVGDSGDGPLTKDSVAAEQTKEREEVSASLNGDENAVETPDELQKRLKEEEEERQRKREEDMDALVPMAEAKVWVVGKPPELGGDTNEYSRYMQKPLGYIQMMRFMGLVTNAMSEAVKAGGTIAMEDLWGGEGLSWRERGERLRSQDFADAGSFAAMALKLISYSPNFLLDCYVLWLDVPPHEKEWAKRVMASPWRPEDGKWGLKEDDGFAMIETFIDQNFEDIRSFFVEKLPRLMLRISKQERDRKAKVEEAEDTASLSSKLSKPSAPAEATR